MKAQLKELRALGKQLNEKRSLDSAWSGTTAQFDLVMPPILPEAMWESNAVKQQRALMTPDAPPCTYQFSCFRSQTAFLDDVPAQHRHGMMPPLVVKGAEDLKWLYIVPLVPLNEAFENERQKAADPNYVEPERMSREFSLGMAGMDSWPLERLAPYLADWERDFASVQSLAPIDHSEAAPKRQSASAAEQVFEEASVFAESQGRVIAWAGLPLQQKLKLPNYLLHLGIDPAQLDVSTLPGAIEGFIKLSGSGHIIEAEGRRLWAEVMPMLPSKERSEVPPRIAIEPGRISVTAATGWLVAYGKRD
jgi:hypothetical protein